jgi:hypothetical protein
MFSGQEPERPLADRRMGKVCQAWVYEIPSRKRISGSIFTLHHQGQCLTVSIRW